MYIKCRYGPGGLKIRRSIITTDRCYFYVGQVIGSHYQLRADDNVFLRSQRVYARVPQYGGQHGFHLVHGEFLTCKFHHLLCKMYRIRTINNFRSGFISTYAPYNGHTVLNTNSPLSKYSIYIYVRVHPYLSK